MIDNLKREKVKEKELMLIENDIEVKKLQKQVAAWEIEANKQG